MPQGTLPKPDQNSAYDAGQRHSDDLFKHFEQQYQNPTGSSVGEDAAIDRAKASSQQMANAETVAAKSASGSNNVNTPSAIGKQENNPRSPLLKDYYRRSKDHRKKTNFFNRRKGILIGVGAGGGLLSMIAGFAFLLPFKLPGIMDGIVNFTGQRVEHVVERRAERIFMEFVIRGSSASVANGTAIVTGNPLGDFFANMRTAKFEERLLNNYGLKFEPTSDKRVKIVHDNRDMGSFRNVEQLEQFLNKDDLTTREIRQAFKLVVKDEIPSWRFFKRAKFVNWLRLKYNIERFGVREAQEDEKPEEYRKAVQKEHGVNVSKTGIRNLARIGQCLLSGDCKNLDKLGGAQQLSEKTSELVEETAEETVTKQLAGQTTETLSKTLVPKLVSATSLTAAAGTIPMLGQVDIAARLVHLAGDEINNQVLQKQAAEFKGDASAALAANYAGYADQLKAGEMSAEVAGDFSDRSTGAELAASFDLIDNGTGKGERLSELEKVNENISTPAFAEIGRTLFNGPGWIARAPLEAWFYTISQGIDAVGEAVFDVLGGATSWVIKNIPNAEALMNLMMPNMAFIYEGLYKLVGMYIDPYVTGAKWHLYVTQGFEVMFNTHAKELGMRLLSDAQAREIDRQIALERAETLKTMSASERLFDLNSSDSLASSLVRGMPSIDRNSPFASMALAGARLVKQAPSNIASITTPRAQAASSVSLFGINYYGGTEADLSAALSTEGTLSNNECPENNPNSFNHCRVDRAVVESMNCSIVKCQDMGQ